VDERLNVTLTSLCFIFYFDMNMYSEQKKYSVDYVDDTLL
jgi:hypothetical protein